MTTAVRKLVGATLIAIWPAVGYAAGNPAAASGIVAEHCARCHEVPGHAAQHGGASMNAMPFQSIADQPTAYTEERLRTFLQRPHFPMAQFILSPSDIDNVVAFIENLRKK